MQILIPSPETIQRAADCLRSGDLVGMPTETVYGLAGDAANPAAIQKIYGTKNRPTNNPLIIHTANMESAMQLGEFDDTARALASVFWPGPLTLVLPNTSSFIKYATIAIRVPSHPVVQSLLRAFAGPIAAPSANRSGRLSPTQANHVADAFHGMDQPKIILAGGRAETGIESTIVSCLDAAPKILRPGSITLEQLRGVVPETLPFTHNSSPDEMTNAQLLSPGLLTQHYAPRTRLRLNVAEIYEGEALLAFGPEPLWTRRAVRLLNLSPSGDLTEAAQNLFSHLHILDNANAAAIAVMPIPFGTAGGLGDAIKDRLMRAATR